MQSSHVFTNLKRISFVGRLGRTTPQITTPFSRGIDPTTLEKRPKMPNISCTVVLCRHPKGLVSLILACALTLEKVFASVSDPRFRKNVTDAKFRIAHQRSIVICGILRKNHKTSRKEILLPQRSVGPGWSTGRHERAHGARPRRPIGSDSAFIGR